jgi:hypothetical protein
MTVTSQPETISFPKEFVPMLYHSVSNQCARRCWNTAGRVPKRTEPS